ncbi:MAG: adenylyltransferase/cytidyltransferase family protein [Ruminococcus flavefaciens]|nr:adenylyltransferase/cytidyltransferase family protein [Ruminococcus flavefaciens]
MKRVITVGVFDYFHIGHLRLFEFCKKYGDWLIVAVQEEDYVLKYKPFANILYTTKERCDMVGALRIVDEVITYKRVDEIIKKVNFNVWIIGEDQRHEGFDKALAWCEENGRGIIRAKRTPGISSSDIKRETGTY